MDINISSQIVVQTAAQWAADNTVYSAKRILVTSDAYYGSTDQRKFKIADGTQTWSQLDYMTLVQNGATNTYLPKSNGTDLVNSLLYEYADGIKIPNGKFITNPNAQAAVYFAADYVALLGIGANFNEFESVYVSPATAGLKSSINNFLVSEAARMILKHDTKVEIDTPTILLTQGTASRIVETDPSKNLTFAAKGTAYNKDFGTGTTNIVEIGSTLGNSLITSTDANGKLQTLSTSSYPNLTELSYIKGITSTPKGFVLQGAVNAQNPADGIIYYFADANIGSGTGTSGQVRLYIPKTATLKGAVVYIRVGGVLGTSEQGTLAVRLNSTTDIVISSAVTWDAVAASFSNYSLNQGVTQGDYVEFKITSPTWATNPTTVSYTASLYFE